MKLKTYEIRFQLNHSNLSMLDVHLLVCQLELVFVEACYLVIEQMSYQEFREH